MKQLTLIKVAGVVVSLAAAGTAFANGTAPEPTAQSATDLAFIATDIAEDAQRRAGEAEAQAATNKTNIGHLGTAIGTVNGKAEAAQTTADANATAIANIDTADQTSLDSSYSIGGASSTANVSVEAYGGGANLNHTSTNTDGSTYAGNVNADSNNTGLSTERNHSDGSYDSAWVNSRQGSEVEISCLLYTSPSPRDS